MGFRFRRSIKIAPGIHLNVGKTGKPSISVGVRGAHVTVGSKGVTTSVGIPGTGLSYQTFESWRQRGRSASPPSFPVSSAAPARFPWRPTISVAIATALVLGGRAMRADALARAHANHTLSA